MRKYLKTREKRVVEKLSFKKAVAPIVKVFTLKRAGLILGSVVFLVMLASSFVSNEIAEIPLSEDDKLSYSITPSLAAASTKRGVISIPKSMVKANPFLPYRDLGGETSALDVSDFDLVPPPDAVNTNSDAARVMDTIVSGILYDKYSPSAILNIEGNDYLVKKNDEVNGYKVVNIAKDSVTVKLGSNVYKAGIGEILTEGELNHNEVSNLSNKFGGIK